MIARENMLKFLNKNHCRIDFKLFGSLLQIPQSFFFFLLFGIILIGQFQTNKKTFFSAEKWIKKLIKMSLKKSLKWV
jgi:hypothetical protein